MEGGTDSGSMTGHETMVKPSGTFKGTPYFDCDNGTFSKCMQGKKKFKKWNTFLKDSPLHDTIKDWQGSSYKNKQSQFILRNTMTGEMVNARSPS